MKARSSHILLIVTIVLYLVFRLPNLGTLPYWYWDEGVNMNMAYNVAHARPLWFTLIFPFVPHPPFYLLIGGTLLRIFGNELIILRAFSVLLGLTTMILLYLTGRELGGSFFGNLASFLYAVYPMSIYWDRMAFANNLLSMLMIFTIYALIKYYNTGLKRFLFTAGLMVGFSTITQYTGITLLVSLVAVMYLQKDINIKAIFVAVLPFTVLIILMLSFMLHAFTDDIMFQINRFNLAGFLMTASVFILIILVSYAVKSFRNAVGSYLRRLSDYSPTNKISLAEYDIPIFLISVNFVLALDALHAVSDKYIFTGLSYFLVGIIGLLLLKRGTARTVILLFFIPFFLLTLKIGRTDHMTIPLTVFLVIGLAAFIIRLYHIIRALTSNRQVISGFTILLVLPFVLIVFHDAQAFLFGGLEREGVSDRLLLADFLNNNTGSKEYVLVDSHQGRYLRVNSSILLQGIAVDGVKVSYYRGDYGIERFTYNVSYHGAKYIVLEDASIPWLNDTIFDVASDISGWGVREEFGRFLVYTNPIFEQ